MHMRSDPAPTAEETEKAQLDQAAQNAAEKTPQPYKDLIEKTIKEKNTIQRNRQKVERQWLVNIAFLYGKHYFEIDRKNGQNLEERVAWELRLLDKKQATRRTVNYILPLYRSLLARMLQLKQRVTVDPLTNQERDISAARVANEALEDFWLNVNKTNPVLSQTAPGMLGVFLKVLSYSLVCGRAHVIPIYNPNAKAKVMFENLPNKPIMDAEVGAVECEIESPFNVFSDPMRRYRIVKRVLSVSEIEETYGVTVPAEDVGLTDTEKQLLNLLDGNDTDRYQDAAEVFIRWEIPSKKYPGGRLWVCTKQQMLLEPTEIPREYKGRIPIFDIDYLDFGFGAPQGVVEQLIPSQEEYNHTVNRLSDYKKWMAGKVMLPDNCKISTRWDDQIGQILKYDATGGKPTFEMPPSPPAFIQNDLPRIRRDMEDIASTHDASQGRTPKGVQSNVAIETLSELDQTQLSPQLMQIEIQMSFFCDMVLDIMEDKYSEQRLIGITGKQLAQDVRSFTGDKVSGNRRVKFSMGSNLPFSREARQAKIEEWLKAGLITKEEARDMLEFGSLDGVLHSIDDSAERMEIQEMLRGVEVIPMQWENHSRRIKIITDFMMGEDFKKLQAAANQGNQQAQAIVAHFIAHRKQHQDYLSAEMQSMQPQAQLP